MRQVTIQGKGPDGKRTSASVHAGLYEALMHVLEKKYNYQTYGECDNRLKVQIRKYIKQGFDSWTITNRLIHWLMSLSGHNY